MHHSVKFRIAAAFGLVLVLLLAAMGIALNGLSVLHDALGGAQNAAADVTYANTRLLLLAFAVVSAVATAA